MAITRSVEFMRTLTGTPALVQTYPEAASQTFKAGDLVYRNGGYVTVCGANPSLVLGVALEDAHNDAQAGTHEIQVLIINGWTEFVMQVYHSTSDNNKIEASDLGKKYGIAVINNLWYVNKTDTTNTRVIIHDFLDPVGTVNGRVGVVFLAANREVA